MIALVEEEEFIREQQEQVMVEKLAKLLMMSRNRRLNVVRFNELRRNFGLPDDYLVRILPKYPDIFQIVNRGGGKRSTMEIELLSWDPKLAVSAIEVSARENNIDPGFEFCLPSSWRKSRERFLEFNENVPYISPYSEVGVLQDGREFRLPEKLNALLLGHPGIFYVSNKYQIHTVVLREGYCGSELINKDSLVVVKEKFGELMQEGLHEYNRRRRAANLEKKRKRGMVAVRSERGERRSIGVMSDSDDNGGPQKDAYSLEERRRFYKALLDDNERPTRLGYLVVLGDDPKPKEERGKNLLNKRPKTLFNYYANGSGWWDCDMEGVDGEEVGCVNIWEIVSTTLGG
ncbi:hypothetical protein MRB53_014377 [Persea americana]|uniref:Uncharacterized protein n=1 Tax=Persea americana TaxID=3435 RepID=A0ACC2KAS9_PERAE|nr:hypothetical protein MRB53_014377 [Persea americana]